MNRAEPRKVGILTFEHKTGGSLTIANAETIQELVRNDRRKDHRLLAKRNNSGFFDRK